MGGFPVPSALDVGVGVVVGVDVGVENKEKEEGGSDANTDADLLGIGLEPNRTDLGLLIMQRRSSERKIVAKTFPQKKICGGDDHDVNGEGFGVQVGIVET